MADRKDVFDAIKAARNGEPFSAVQVGAIDALLDALGVPPVGSPGEVAPTHDAFDAALTQILIHEGGFVNHPKDPGGMTNLGVTKRTWEDWTGNPATEAEMRALTRGTVAPLYRKNYWDAVEGDNLPPPLALCVFDFAVNAGPGRAARYLQRLVNVPQDGRIGPQTLAAVTGYVRAHGITAAVQAYQEARRAYYRSLSTFGTFGKGWLRRVGEVEGRALELAA